MVAPATRSDGAPAWLGEGLTTERDRPRAASAGRLGAGTTDVSGRTRRDRSRDDTSSRPCTSRTLRDADNRKGRRARTRVHGPALLLRSCLEAVVTRFGDGEIWHRDSPA